MHQKQPKSTGLYNNPTRKLKSLKSNKSCGPDNITNEMLKKCSPELQNALQKLLNLILSSGVFPEVWNTGLISPIFKSVDKTDPNQNYRGICVNNKLSYFILRKAAQCHQQISSNHWSYSHATHMNKQTCTPKERWENIYMLCRFQEGFWLIKPFKEVLGVKYMI